MGISYSGKKTEQVFCSLAGASSLPKSDSRGDAFLVHRGERHFIEVKKVGSGAANQVRPCKYTTLVVWSEKEDEWYVIPPQDVVNLAKPKKGQHAVNSFECCNFGKKQWRQEKYRSDTQSLYRRVRLAIEEGNNASPLYRKVMAQVRQDALTLKERQIRALEGGTIDT